VKRTPRAGTLGVSGNALAMPTRRHSLTPVLRRVGKEALQVGRVSHLRQCLEHRGPERPVLVEAVEDAAPRRLEPRQRVVGRERLAPARP
jgi:hypothetical protein